VDVHVVKWADPAQSRVLLSGRSDRLGWPAMTDAQGASFYMTDERTLPGGTLTGTLNRVSPETGVRDSVPDIIVPGQGGELWEWSTDQGVWARSSASKAIPSSD
jgi:hypothetical protein